MAYQSPIEVLYTDTVARLTALGQTLAHYLGEREKSQQTNINRYVWIPTRVRVEKDDVATVSVDEIRNLYVVTHLAEVRCWGQSREVAYMMASNLIKAAHDVAQADLDLEDINWNDEATEGHTDFGFLLVVEFGLRGCFADEFVAITEYAGAAQSLTGPDAPSVQPTIVEFTAYAGPDLDADDEEMGNGTTEDPP